MEKMETAAFAVGAALPVEGNTSAAVGAPRVAEGEERTSAAEAALVVEERTFVVAVALAAEEDTSVHRLSRSLLVEGPAGTWDHNLEEVKRHNPRPMTVREEENSEICPCLCRILESRRAEAAVADIAEAFLSAAFVEPHG